MDFYIDGKIVAPDTRITDFRGKTHLFIRVEEDSSPGKSGKVTVVYNDSFRQFYPTVFNGEIR